MKYLRTTYFSAHFNRVVAGKSRFDFPSQHDEMESRFLCKHPRAVDAINAIVYGFVVIIFKLIRIRNNKLSWRDIVANVRFVCDDDEKRQLWLVSLFFLQPWVTRMWFLVFLSPLRTIENVSRIFREENPSDSLSKKYSILFSALMIHSNAITRSIFYFSLSLTSSRFNDLDCVWNLTKGDVFFSLTFSTVLLDTDLCTSVNGASEREERPSLTLNQAAKEEVEKFCWLVASEQNISQRCSAC